MAKAEPLEITAIALTNDYQATDDMNMADVAQLVRATGCGPVGRGFETHHSPHMRGRRITANIPAFQASDESSILSARTTGYYENQ